MCAIPDLFGPIQPSASIRGFSSQGQGVVHLLTLRIDADAAYLINWRRAQKCQATVGPCWTASQLGKKHLTFSKWENYWAMNKCAVYPINTVCPFQMRLCGFAGNHGRFARTQYKKTWTNFSAVLNLPWHRSPLRKHVVRNISSSWHRQRLISDSVEGMNVPLVHTGICHPWFQRKKRRKKKIQCSQVPDSLLITRSICRV